MSDPQRPALTDRSLARMATVIRKAMEIEPDDALVRSACEWFAFAFAGAKREDGTRPDHPLVWRETPHVTGTALFNMEQGKPKRRMPMWQTDSDPLRNHPKQHRLMWSRPLTEDERKGGFVVGFDVNCQFLAAAKQPLGSGPALHKAKRVERITKDPGYYRLTLRPGATTPDMPSLATPSGWYTAPVAQYLAKLDQVDAIHESWTYPEHNLWLDGWYQRTRDARLLLLDERWKDTPAARGALAAVKTLYTVFLGGWLNSPRTNPTPLYRPDWRWSIVGQAQVREFIALEKVRATSGRTPFLVFLDSAYYIDDRPMGVPDGLEVSVQGGKWKLHRTAELTPDLLAAIDSGRTPNMVNKAIKKVAVEW